MNYTTIILVVALIIIVVGIFVIPRFMMQQALKEVIKAFRRCNATSAGNAKTLEELGLQPRSFTERLYKSRDYRPYAIDFMEKGGIIVTTEDGKLYLLEDKLPEKLKNMES